MNLLPEWLKATRQIFTSAESFFENEQRRDGFGHPLKFAGLSFLLSGVLMAGRVMLLGSGEITVSILNLASGLIGGLVGLTLGAGIVHVLASVLGGEKGFSRTFAALAYSSCVAPIAAAFLYIPLLGSLLNVVLMLFAVYVQIKGVEKFQEMSTGRAAIAVLLPASIAVALGTVFLLGGIITIFAAQAQIAAIA